MAFQIMQRRRLVALALALLAAMVLVTPTLARGVSWCRADPIVKLNGAIVRFDVAIPEEHIPYVTGPIDITIQTPRGVSRELLFTDPGFNGYGETVRFGDMGGTVSADGSFPVKIQVKVPMASGYNAKVPMMVDIYEGTGNVAHVEVSSNTTAVVQITVKDTH